MNCKLLIALIDLARGVVAAVAAVLVVEVLALLGESVYAPADVDLHPETASRCGLGIVSSCLT